MRSYEDLQYAFLQLELAARYQEAGRLEGFIRNTGNALWGDEDFLYTYWYELLNALADFVDIREDEDTLICRMYFSDALRKGTRNRPVSRSSRTFTIWTRSRISITPCWITARTAAGSAW